jgi:hypothetical protein
MHAGVGFKLCCQESSMAANFNLWQYSPGKNVVFNILLLLGSKYVPFFCAT